MTYLLDVNVLIAMIDADHRYHDAAHNWFATIGHADWATCPIIENGVIRILSNSRYPGRGRLPLPATVVQALSGIRRSSGHSFWPDDLSLIDNPNIALTEITQSNDVTDTYLLALAKARGGQLATFDRRVRVDAVAAGSQALHIIAEH